MSMWSATRKAFPLMVQDTSDSDNQLALAGYLQAVTKDLSKITKPTGIWAVSPRHADLSFPGAFNKAIVGNRSDFRSFEPVKNLHEGSGLVCRADSDSTDQELLNAPMEDSQLMIYNEIRRTYSSVMMSVGLDPFEQSSWEFILRAFPCLVMPLPAEHLLSHHYFAREFLFDRGDLEGKKFGMPLTAKSYSRIVNEIDGEVAADSSGAYDRKEDVKRGLAKARRQRARKILQDALDIWDGVLGTPHKEWIQTCETISKSHFGLVTDVLVMAPVTLTDEHWERLRNAKRLWGMFFALDNAAEYGHWVVDDKAKNIFRNNFNTALDEEGTLRMLKAIHKKELRAHFHPTELFKGDLGQHSWATAREIVKPVHELMAEQGDTSKVPPMLGLYNCYNCAKSPKGDPQQISDPLTVFEFLNFIARFEQDVTDTSFDPDSFMPVASYSPSLIQADNPTTQKNYQAACDFAKSKGIPEDQVPKLVRKEQVFVVKFTYEPLNNGMYAGHGLVKRMLPEYSGWLRSLLEAHPPLKAPEQQCATIPIMESTRNMFLRSNMCVTANSCAADSPECSSTSQCSLM
eukprot:gb/GFBE01027498.1/.p1 GENE.gb/GFBE01027498.1/~~gb/GFBE01027498.1/.p1  ORF type:complete len:573 (+),score=114.33 gb/GFBE01027498.1/:1-1719(+)